jgi:hypothetical protein
MSWTSRALEAEAGDATEALAGLRFFVPRPPMRLNKCSSCLATVAILMSSFARRAHLTSQFDIELRDPRNGRVADARSMPGSTYHDPIISFSPLVTPRSSLVAVAR